MAEWSWVALGYGVAYATLLGYTALLVRRLAAARARREGRR